MRKSWRSYALAVVLTLSAALFTKALEPWVEFYVTPLFFLSTVLSATYGGIGPGLTASILSTIFLLYFYIPPLYTLWVITPSELEQALVFLVTAVLVSTLTAERRQALAQAQAAAEAAERAHEQARLTTRRLTQLQNVTVALSHAATPAEIFEVMVREAASQLNWNAAAILLKSNNGAALLPVMAAGPTSGHLAEAPDRALSTLGPASDVAQSGQPLWFSSPGELAARYPQAALAHHPSSAFIPLALDGRVMGTLALTFAEPRDFPEEVRNFLLTVARQCAQALERVYLYAEEHRSRAELEMRIQQATASLVAANESLQHEIAERQQMQARLEHSREEERARLAREMHDELGGDLTGLIFSVNWLLTLPGVSEEAREHLTNLAEDIEATLWSVRRLATELHPVIIQRLGLLGALEWQFGEFLTRTDLDGEFTNTLDDLPLGDEQATACFRIFQEALTNVARHAHATWVEAMVDTEDGCVVLSVADNGCGLPQDDSLNRGLGFAGMRERAALLAAELDIGGAPGQGTRVALRLPAKRLEIGGR